MRKLRLKEKDTDNFLQLEDTGKGVLLVLEESGNMMAQFSLTLKQMIQIREWGNQAQNEFFKKNRLTSNARKEKK